MTARTLMVLGALTCVLTVGHAPVQTQQLGTKVFWMATSTVPVGKLADYHAFAEKTLLPLQEKHGYHFIGAWQTIVGDIENVVVIAEFENMAAYHKARVALLGSPEWQKAGAQLDQLTRGVSTTFLSATPYSRIK